MLSTEAALPAMQGMTRLAASRAPETKAASAMLETPPEAYDSVCSTQVFLRWIGLIG